MGDWLSGLRPLPLLGAVVLWVCASAPLGAQVTAEVRGTITDSSTAVPIGGARIELRGTTLDARTTTDGRFLFRNLDPGPIQLRVTAVGYQARVLVLDVRNGTATVVQVLLAPVPVVVEEIVVRGEAPAPFGVDIIGRAAIDSSRARDLAELLDGRAGLQVVRTGGVGSRATLSIRGSNADQVLVLLDGASMNDPVTGAADLSTISLGAIQQVTVVRGAASARYGSGALAGVVTLVTRQPTGQAVGLAAEAGSFGERALQGRGGGATRVGDWVLSGNAALQARRSAGDFWYTVPPVRGGGDARRQNADARLTTVSATASGRTGGTELRGRLEWFGVERGMPGPVVQPTLTARQDQRRRGGGIGAGVAIGSWSSQVDAVFRRQLAQFEDPNPPARPAYDDSVRVSESVLRLVSSGPLPGGTGGLGVEARRQAFVGSTLAPDAPTEATYTGVWGTGRWPVLRGRQRLEISAALRADRTSTLDGVFWSPHVSVTYSAGPASLAASWGQAFSPPTLGDQFFQEGVLVRSNPDLGPERVHGEWQIGASLNPTSVGVMDMMAEFSAYRADVDGMILWQPNFQFVWSPNNFDVRRSGIDVAFRATHRPSQIALHGSYSLTDIRYTGPVLTGQVVYRPRHSGSVGVSAPWRQIRADAAARYVGERRTVAGSPLNALPGYWMVDLGASVRLPLGAWHGDAFLRIENLFDTRAALLADYPLPSRAVRVGFGVDH